MEDRGPYPDLIREFWRNGNNVFIVVPKERRKNVKTNLQSFKNFQLLQVKTFNIQKASLIEKGVGTLALDFQFRAAINRYFQGIMFDILIFSTPPITFNRVIKTIKKVNNCGTYLLLKDIFPQNAVDLGIMKRGGIFHRFFIRKERELYRLSDYIGCMSPANVEYLLKHNPEISPKIVEVCPNSIDPIEMIRNGDNSSREKFNIPDDAMLFIYGGNLGKPQGLDFLLQVLMSNSNKIDRYFMIVGSGTEYPKIERWFKLNKPDNAKLIERLPKHEYDTLVMESNVGLIFLDPNFTIPNYPSRLLPYLENKIPVLLATDIHTDIGRIAEKHGYGYWSVNGDLEHFNAHIDRLCGNKQLTKRMGEKGHDFLMNNYTVQKSYQTIIKHFS